MEQINIKSKTIKVDQNFYNEIIRKIIEQEKEKGSICSNPNAFRILHKRIMKLGGLKEDNLK